MFDILNQHTFYEDLVADKQYFWIEKCYSFWCAGRNNSGKIITQGYKAPRHSRECPECGERLVANRRNMADNTFSKRRVKK